MSKKIKLDNVEYDTSNLTDNGVKLLAAYVQANQMLQEAVNMKAVLTKAKQAYISELKMEMLKGRTGLDLSNLFSDD